ncbi:MAG: hypothetical protein Q4P33_03835 [Flaviflexus sp.]|nr:hypothetical protein [Flaviflexus sp.]
MTVVKMLLFGGAAVVSLWLTWMEGPNAREKKTGRQRSYRERWRLMSGQLRGQLICGLISAVIAGYFALKLLAVMS